MQSANRMATYVDAMVARRADGRMMSHRMLYLLAHAVTDPYETDREKMLALMHWVHVNTQSPESNRPGISDNYMRSAQEILEHGHGVCGSRAEVMATLVWYAGYPSRRVGVYGTDDGHTITEVYVDDRWSIFDAHFDEVYPLEDGTPAHALECHHRPALVEQVHKGLGRIYECVEMAETVWSIDGYYMEEKIVLGPDTVGYLYDSARDPKVRELIAERRMDRYYIVRLDEVKRYGKQQ